MSQIDVFPARAGMSRYGRIARIHQVSVPRASGDEPVADLFTLQRGKCSPRERG